MSFERFAVVRVPFPFTDRNATKNRPALVLSDDASFNTPAGHSVMAMVTSQGNASWPLDCQITDLTAAGLPAPSLVRFKLFTLDHGWCVANSVDSPQQTRRRFLTDWGNCFQSNIERRGDDRIHQTSRNRRL